MMPRPEPPRPVAYASAGMVAEDAAEHVRLPARAGSDATLATAWLAVLVGAGYAAFGQFESDQSNGLDVLGRLLRYPSAWSAVDAVRFAAGPAVTAAAVGAFAAAALWHWPRSRLAWAAVLPPAAAGWFLVQSNAVSLFNLSGVAVPLGAIVVWQSAVVVTATRFGRPVARWLAARLLPPGMRELAVALWSGR